MACRTVARIRVLELVASHHREAEGVRAGHARASVLVLRPLGQAPGITELTVPWVPSDELRRARRSSSNGTYHAQRTHLGEGKGFGACVPARVRARVPDLPASLLPTWA